jgi:transposase InsO family protein
MLPARPRSQRNRSDEELSAKVRASFLASDRTYGARSGTTFSPKGYRVDCIGSSV